MSYTYIIQVIAYHINETPSGREFRMTDQSQRSLTTAVTHFSSPTFQDLPRTDSRRMVDGPGLTAKKWHLTYSTLTFEILQLPKPCNR